ncbi:ribbon-helix-helix protein, CopG family [Tepidiphilus margaritifer]|uniref:ribbon-helix-helix protein, CopG family n=1 Tax=Tepidiphilus margaritifer TaxID=203471 RepID=UPI0003FAD2CE|nr:CopG family transcriptional regulator [Tepidiphilus margaritifer]
MRITLELDEDTARQIQVLTGRDRARRNALIREALYEWLSRQGRAQWPESVLRFEGDADMPPFERSREELIAPPEDPLT